MKVSTKTATFSKIFRLALVLLPSAALTLNAKPAQATVLLVPQGTNANWQDFAYLAAVPAASKANGGNAAVIALEAEDSIPREVEDYLRRFKPTEIYHLGSTSLVGVQTVGKLLELSCTNADDAANLLAATFWKSSARVVLCCETDYGSALMASTLAARLRVPLILCGDSGLSPQASKIISQLKAKELIFVGQAPAGMKVTELGDPKAVIEWLKQHGLETRYLALVNVLDRSGTTVHKLSLAAPILAAARNGMVLPIDREICWRKPFEGTPVTEGIATNQIAPKKGVIDLSEGKIPFYLTYGEPGKNSSVQFNQSGIPILTAHDKSGKNPQLWLDLNGNGLFSDAGEGPFEKNGVISLLGKPYSLDFNRYIGGRKCDLSVSTGNGAEEICLNLRELYKTIGVPDYLCLVGFPDAIPQAILPHQQLDATSDRPYGNIDDDLFTEIAVGRVIAENATFATLYASRVVTYDSLLSPEWSGKAGQARWENTLTRNFENVGLDATATHDVQDLAWVEPPSEGKKGKRADNINADSPLTCVAFLGHEDHSWWKALGSTYTMNSTVLLAPAVVESGGCITCNLDYEPGFRSVVARLFRNGAVSFTGQTRVGIAQQEHQRVVFWNQLLAGDSIGEAHRAAQNSMAATVQNTEQNMGDPDFYQLNIRSLFGDPAFTPHVPSQPKSAPARVKFSGEKVTVYAPETWWPVKIKVPEDWKAWTGKPLYVVRGAGAYPERSWCNEQYDRENIFVDASFTTKRKVKAITQVQTLPAPLGWDGKYAVDENPDGTRTYRWQVRLIDFDQKTGTIINQTERADFRITFGS